MNEVLILLAVALIFAYMLHCKRGALARKAELAAILETMFRSNELSEDEKRTMSAVYDSVDSWLTLPALFVSVPLSLFFAKKRSTKKTAQEKNNKEIMGKFITKWAETVVAGNPIASLALMLWTVMWLLSFIVLTGFKKWLWIVLAFTSPTLVQASPADTAQNMLARTLSTQQHVLHKLRATHR
ncbi:hypothetical protein [Aeromonas caviae]|uniref:hypothetical protein n=1 Tax=Aeromonas caviae TaxID=648 RepID=UPI003014C5FC